MKLCASYHIPVNMWSNLDEIRFTTQSLGQAIEYAHQHPQTRVIVEILSLSDCGIAEEKLLSLCKAYENFSYDLYDVNDFITLTEKLPHRCLYHFPVTTYNMLYLLIQEHVADITLGEPLVFDLKNLQSNLAHNGFKPQIRIRPAEGRPDLFNTVAAFDSGIQHGWLLPQHIELYEPYIDVIDIVENNIEREKTLVELFLRRNYSRELKYYLRNSSSEMPADLVTDEFVTRRLNCRQVCLQSTDNVKCHYCMAEEALYAQLRERQHSDNPIKIQSQS